MVRVTPVAASEKPELWAALQRYIREMTAYDDSIQSVDDVFHYEWFDAYWRSRSRWPFWAERERERLGFALVRREDSGTMDMAEFFIEPAHRRTGAGLAFARLLLEMFPGPWNISEYRANAGAVSFWRKVAADYAFSEEAYIGDSGKPRLLQRVLVKPQGGQSPHVDDRK